MSAVIESPQRYSVTVDEFVRMAEAGVFGPESRLELIEGEIIAMAPIGSRHAGAVKSLIILFAPITPARVIISVQDPAALGERSMPQPDVALLKPRTDRYARSHPTPNDILLVIEVADTSLQYDLGTKVPLYARYGIIETWVFDTEERSVRVHRDPSSTGYRTTFTVAGDGEVAPLALPDFPVALRAVFPA